MTRQTERSEARAIAKMAASSAKITARVDGKRDLLSRQSVREKAGFYSERGVARNISPSRSRINSRLVQKGKAYGRIIKTVDGMALHATKGWRKA